MLDITTPTGTARASHLFDEGIIISPRLAIVVTSTAPTTWAQHMTQDWQQDPNKCALSLRLRDSDPTRDKKIAEVAATREQISAAKARKGHQEVSPTIDKPLTLRATIDLPMKVDAGSHSWLPLMMAHIGQVTGITLQQHKGDTGLDLGTWKAIHNFEGTWTGRVLVQCNTAKELLTIYSTIQNKGLDIQGHTTAVNMHSDYIDLEQHTPDDF